MHRLTDCGTMKLQGVFQDCCRDIQIKHVQYICKIVIENVREREREQVAELSKQWYL